jgi:uncharacterized membrane protein/uncharacterized membrane protein YeaQ/YmgE (transglycosylase-associated protein family)
MHVLTWILIGLLAGWLARLAQGGRGASLIADLTLGLLGAVVGGWLLRLLGLTEPGAGWGHVLVAFLGSLLVLATWRLALHLTARAAALAGASRAASTLENLEAQIGRLGEFERQFLARAARRKRVARDPNQAFDEQLTLGQRMADRLASFGGSWAFLGLFFAVLLGWMIYNTERAQPFDPYPFILLNLVLSCLAAVQAPVILMTQNRLAAKDRLDAHLDYEVNLKAELEILALHEKLDGLREKAWSDLVALQERQLALLDRIERVTAGRAAPGA